MPVIEFFKTQASGNDFILIDQRTKGNKFDYKKIAKSWCQRKFGIGADGLLVIEPSKKADFKMRIFNSDGSEAEMCGNGARCTALWAKLNNAGKQKNSKIKFETVAGIIEAQSSLIKGGAANIKIKMTDVSQIELDKQMEVGGRKVKVNFLNTGVPHTVVFVEGLDNIDVEGIGSQIRFYKDFMPAGTNVNFVEVAKDDLIKIRTYERGVEAETLACGTGSVASAIVSRSKLAAGTKSDKGQCKVGVCTKSGETLSVYFHRRGNKVTDIWLEGKAYLVYQGKLNSN